MSARPVHPCLVVERFGFERTVAIAELAMTESCEPAFFKIRENGKP